MKAFGEFLFGDASKRRNRTECLHDMLIVAKEGKKKTRIMYASNLSWEPMVALLKSAEANGLIEEIEAPKHMRHYVTKRNTIWMTTAKGNMYAKTIYDNFKIFEVVDG